MGTAFAYEISDFQTIGGDQSSGPYTIYSPWAGPADLLLLSVASDGVATLYLTEEGDTSKPVIMQGPFRGLVLPFAAAGIFMLGYPPVPVAGRSMQLAVSAAGGVHGYLNYVWRRALPSVTALDDAQAALAAGIAAAPTEQQERAGVSTWQRIVAQAAGYGPTPQMRPELEMAQNPPPPAKLPTPWESAERAMRRRELAPRGGRAGGRVL